MRGSPCHAPPAAPAAPDAVVLLQPQAVGVYLVDPAYVGQGVASRPLQPHRGEQTLTDEEIEQALQEGFGLLCRHAPLLRHLTDRRFAVVAEPLGDEFCLLLRLTAKFGAGGSANLGKVALLHLEIAVHPVFAENFSFGVVQHPFTPQVVEQRRHAVAQVFGRHPEGVRLLLDPGQRCI